MRRTTIAVGTAVATLLGFAANSPALSAVLDGGTPPAAAPVAADGKPVAATGSPSAIDIVKDVSKNKDIFSFDYGVPQSPALALIGTNETLAGSSALKPYAFQAPASYGGAKGAQSFALDVAPAWFLMPWLGIDNSYDRYVGWKPDGSFDLGNSYPVRLLNRTRAGGSLYLGDNGGGDPTKAKDSRIAFGLSVSLLDQSDPLSVVYPDSDKEKLRAGAPVWARCVDDAYNAVSDDYDAKYAKEAADYRTQNTGFDNNYYNDFLLILKKADQNPASLTSGDIGRAVADADNCQKDVCKGYPAAAADVKKAAATLSTVLSRSGEWVAKLQNLNVAFLEVRTAITDKQNGATAAVAQDIGLPKAFDACVTAANDFARFGEKLDIGGGVVWDGTPGTASGFAKTSGALWLAWRYPIYAPPDPTADVGLLRYWMIGGSLRASWSETVATGNATTPKFSADVQDGWIGLESFSRDFTFIALAGYKRTDAVHTADAAFSNAGFRWQIGSSVRLSRVLTDLVNFSGASNGASNAWLNVTYGSAAGTVKTLDDKELLISISFSPTGGVLGEGG